jgi:hypothetical protein
MQYATSAAVMHANTAVTGLAPDQTHQNRWHPIFANATQNELPCIAQVILGWGLSFEMFNEFA